MRRDIRPLAAAVSKNGRHGTLLAFIGCQVITCHEHSIVADAPDAVANSIVLVQGAICDFYPGPLLAIISPHLGTFPDSVEDSFFVDPNIQCPASGLVSQIDDFPSDATFARYDQFPAIGDQLRF